MKEVRINKAKLLEIVPRNRTDHRNIFLAAQEKYRETVIRVLDESLAAARSKRPFELARIVQLVQPQDHTAEYDKVIRMLELTEDTIIALDDAEFQRFVQDQWGWTRSWAASNSLYTKSPKLGNMGA
jgi:hypothetical protein